MSNKRINVYTDEGIYVLLLDEPPYDDQPIENVITNIVYDLKAECTVWHGWTPYDDPATAPGTIVFFAGTNIRSIKVYDDVTPVNDDSATVDVLTETPIPVVLNVDYLGNKCKVNAIIYYQKDGITFDVLPYEVNGMPAHIALSANNLETMLKAHFTEMGVPLNNFRILATDTTLTETAASKYIAKYNQGVDPLGHTGKAKAWADWNEKEEDDYAE